MKQNKKKKKVQRSIADKFEDLLIKSEKRIIPVLICFTLFLIMINLFWGSDKIVYAAMDNYSYEAAGENTGGAGITLSDRVDATVNRIKTVSYNASYWKTRVFYNNLYEMCADKGIVREKLNSMIRKLTGEAVATEGAAYMPERITPFELGITWETEAGGGEEY